MNREIGQYRGLTIKGNKWSKEERLEKKEAALNLAVHYLNECLEINLLQIQEKNKQ